MKKLLSILLVLSLSVCLLSGCKGTDNQGETDKSGGDIKSNEVIQNSDHLSNMDTENTNATPVDAAFSQADEDMFTDRDTRIEYNESDSVLIQLNGTSAAASSDSVKITGTTITITEEATYILSGTLEDGMIIVNAPDTAKLQLVLNGVNINSETSAPIYILEADKVFLTLADGTENVLSNGGTFTAIDENNIDAAIFSKQDLTFNGNGSLTVTSPVGHGIVCKDDLVFTGGTYTIASSGHGIDANDSFRAVNARFTIDAGKDGVHAENNDDATLGFVYVESGSFTLEAEGDGLSAGAYMTLLSGDYAITAGGGSENAAVQSSDNWGGFMGGGMMRPDGGMGGGKGGKGGVSYNTKTTDTTEDSTSMKGIKASGALEIRGGTYTIDAADDAVHSNADVTVTGGTFTIATGDDGFHADETLTITDGAITITESYEGLEGLHIAISGGDIDLTSSDDGINAAGGTDQSGTGGRDQFGGPGGGMGGMSSGNGSITISGGDVYMNASGDGIDANGTLEIRGGFVVVCGPTQGDTAVLDYDKSAIITGGTFIGTGSTMMAQTFSTESTQGVYAVTVGSQSAGTPVVLKDTSGNTVISYTPELPFGLVILSSGEIVKGESYTITVGTDSGTFTAS